MKIRTMSLIFLLFLSISSAYANSNNWNMENLAIENNVYEKKIDDIDVDANYILEKIENGETVIITNSHIKGDVNLSKLNKTRTKIGLIESPDILEEELKDDGLKIVESKIIIKNSIFENNTDFSYSKFTKMVNFHNTTFLNKVDFSAVSFDNPVNFGDTKFYGDAIFSFARFGSEADFTQANFINNAYFNRGEFKGYIVFTDAIFYKDVKFNATRFEGFFYNFNNATFKQNAMFELARFNDVVYFDDANFANVSFHLTKFNTASFNNTKFNRIYLEGAFFNRIMGLKWDEIKKSMEFDGPTYIQLIKNFREMEQFSDADNAYYQYKSMSPNSFLDKIMWISSDYGISPIRIVKNMILIILLFSIIYFMLEGIEPLEEKKEATFSDAFLFSVVAFFIGPVYFKPVGFSRYLFVIERALGWFLFTLFIITLTKITGRP